MSDCGDSLGGHHHWWTPWAGVFAESVEFHLTSDPPIANPDPCHQCLSVV